jgi:hypothetical protein
MSSALKPIAQSAALPTARRPVAGFGRPLIQKLIAALMVNDHDHHLHSKRASLGYIVDPAAEAGRRRGGWRRCSNSASAGYACIAQAFIHSANTGSRRLVEKPGVPLTFEGRAGATEEKPAHVLTVRA